MNKIIEYLTQYKFKKPVISIILGSGLNSFTEKIKNKLIIDYKDIPNFPKTSIKGHSGELIFGNIGETSIVCASGRFHYYEGYTFKQVSIIVDIFNKLNSKLCIITNSSGCLNLNWKLGDLMLADRFMDFSFISSRENEFYKITSNYFKSILNSAKKNKINLHMGTYTYTMGPTYETPAEIKEIICKGGDVVGMSTFPEFLRCKELKLDCLVISCLTNYGAGLIKNKKINHLDVLSGAKKHQNNFNKLLIDFIENIVPPKRQRK